MKKLAGRVVWVVMAIVVAGATMMRAQNTTPLKPKEGLHGAPTIQTTIQTTKDPKDMSREELTATIKRLDAELFDAYNRCELEKFGSFFPEQLEFYHDQTGGGPMTREQLVGAIKQNICGKVHRERESLEVYRLNNYGAVELGMHRFTHPGIDNDSGTAKFVQLWKYEDGRWWLTRVISYDHGGK